MKISALEVDGFGVWSGLELADLSDELTVFYGVNEAGKTTLMQFVRTMFFGFSANSDWAGKTDCTFSRLQPPQPEIIKKKSSENLGIIVRQF